MRVVAYVPDLMDRSKVSAAAPGAVFVATPEDLVGSLADSGVDVVIVDLSRPGVLEVLAEGPSPGPEGPRRLGFGSHVESARLDRAVALGWEAMARSRFFGRLPELLGGGRSED